ncbi:hypothetical protein M0R45_006061 [Rubus argutus]|uniref:Uncharacterized protein n=1 Tax=Rubus argutus TaxID=59490 RepID=A0AAW1YPA2_RUBAR
MFTTTTTVAKSMRKPKNNVHYISGLNSFSGLKAHNAVALLVFLSVRAILCQDSIMNGLTLIGVAVGFVLLRIEASVEESAE